MATETNERSKRQTVHPPRRKRGEYEVCLCPVCGKEPKVYPYTTEKEGICSLVECRDEKGVLHLRVVASVLSGAANAVQHWNDLVERHVNAKGEDLMSRFASRRLFYLVKSGKATEEEKTAYSDFLRSVTEKNDEIELLKKKIEVATIERGRLYDSLARSMYGQNYERYATERRVVREEAAK